MQNLRVPHSGTLGGIHNIAFKAKLSYVTAVSLQIEA